MVFPVTFQKSCICDRSFTGSGEQIQDQSECYKEKEMPEKERTAYPQGVEKIEQEIEHRKLVVRKEAIEAVKEARAQGDLSENFEYYAAKKHKNQNESRIRYLERMLKTASIVSDASRSDEVGMDDIVEVLFEEDNEVEKYKLVTSIRGNSMENRISIESAYRQGTARSSCRRPGGSKGQ